MSLFCTEYTATFLPIFVSTVGTLEYVTYGMAALPRSTRLDLEFVQVWILAAALAQGQPLTRGARMTLPGQWGS